MIAVKEAGFSLAIGIEANGQNFARMVANIALNECQGKILPIWAAVTNRSFQREALYSNNLGINSGIQSLKYKDSYPSEYVVGLDFHTVLLGLPSIDLLKVDIEGGEWDILCPRYRKDFKKCKWIDIELHVPEPPGLYGSSLGSIDKAKDFLESCGFDLKENPDTYGFYGANVASGL